MTPAIITVTYAFEAMCSGTAAVPVPDGATITDAVQAAFTRGTLVAEWTPDGATAVNHRVVRIHDAAGQVVDPDGFDLDEGDGRVRLSPAEWRMLDVGDELADLLERLVSWVPPTPPGGAAFTPEARFLIDRQNEARALLGKLRAPATPANAR